MEIKTIEKFNDYGVIRYQNSEDNIKNSILRETYSLYLIIYSTKKKTSLKKINLAFWLKV